MSEATGVFNRYYDEELRFLREDGKEFSKKYARARKLFEEGGDPDVERLLEGVAFLCGRIRQEMDQAVPEVARALLDLAHPHLLRPIPRASVLAFEPIPGRVRRTQIVPRGTEVRSIPKDGHVYRFRTTNEVALHPVTLSAVEESLSDGIQRLRIDFQLSPGADLRALAIHDLPVFVQGADPLGTYHWLLRKARRVDVSTNHGSAFEIPLPEPIGFGPDSALIDHPSRSFFGYRLLQEFFACPQKFRFVRFRGLEPLRTMSGDRFSLTIAFEGSRGGRSRLTPDDLHLHCTPIVNVFESDSAPLHVDGTQSEYLVRPSQAARAEIVNVDGAISWLRGAVTQRTLRPFLSFDADAEAPEQGALYHLRRRDSIRATSADGSPDPYAVRRSQLHASFVGLDRAPVTNLPETIVVFRLTCTDGPAADEPRVGDVTEPSDTSPGFARFVNIGEVSPLVQPPVDATVYWRLVSHLALNAVSLEDADGLRALLRAYNFEHLRSEELGLPGERCVRAIHAISSTPETLVVTRALWPDETERLGFGTAIHGRSITIELQDDNLSEGEVFLFGSVLSTFLASYVSINTFSRLTIRALTSSRECHWPPQLGGQQLL